MNFREKIVATRKIWLGETDDLVEEIAIALYKRMVNDYGVTPHRAEDFADWVRGFKRP